MQIPKLNQAVEAVSFAENDKEHRKHLGASIVGKPCRRQAWYIFRWVKLEQFEGRMVRLFRRGQLEEAKFADVLRKTGATVWTEDDEGKQFRVSALNGHFGGSLDGVAENTPGMPEGPHLAEFKTHSEKSFKRLESEGLCNVKFEHFCQCQIYMNLADLPFAVYCAINKNDDALYFEKIERDEQQYEILLERAAEIINSPVALPRLHNSIGYYECKFCDFNQVCHFGKKDDVGKNCRTCTHSSPVKDAKWSCSKGLPIQQYTEAREPNGAMDCPGYKLNEGIFA